MLIYNGVSGTTYITIGDAKYDAIFRSKDEDVFLFLDIYGIPFNMISKNLSKIKVICNPKFNKINANFKHMFKTFNNNLIKLL